jgi:Fe-S-cluster containining protein
MIPENVSAELVVDTTAPAQVVIEGLDEARFECVYPTCGGICCVNGRPPLEAGEDQRIEQNLHKFLPHLRHEARERVAKKGHLTNRRKEGLRALGVSKGWCVFFNEGCVLHKVGAEEGDKWKYKPWRCIAFPLERSGSGRWHVRQWKHRGEAWDLFCLNPRESRKTPRETLKEEVQFVRDLEAGKESWRNLRC